MLKTAKSQKYLISPPHKKGLAGYQSAITKTDLKNDQKSPIFEISPLKPAREVQNSVEMCKKTGEFKPL